MVSSGSEKETWGLAEYELGVDLSMVMEPDGPTYASHFTDLRVWQLGMELTDQVYALSSRFPREELYSLTSQIRRAVVSVTSNIAEGWGRNRVGYLSLGLSYSRGSLHEVESQLYTAVRLKYLSKDEIQPLIDSIGKCSTGLLKFVTRLEEKQDKRGKG